MYSHWDGPNPEPDNTPFGEGRRFGIDVINWHRPDNEDSLPVEEDVGRREGLTRKDIARLPTKVFRSGIDTDSCGDCNSASGGKDEDAIKECSICKGEFENNDKLRILPCVHEYHTRCIHQWIKKTPTCPECRTQVQI